MSDDWQSRITLSNDVLAGKPTIRGLRITVEHIMRALSNGVPERELMADYPDLQPGDLRACLAYCADMIASERVYPIQVKA